MQQKFVKYPAIPCLSITDMSGFAFKTEDAHRRSVPLWGLLHCVLIRLCCFGGMCIAAPPEEFEVLEGFVERPRQVSWEPTSPTELFADTAEDPRAGVHTHQYSERQLADLPALSELPPDIPNGTQPSGPSGQTVSPLLPDAVAERIADTGDGGTESLSRRYDGTLFEQLEEEQRAAYEVYRSAENGWLWMPGGADDFGMLSMYSNAWQPRHNMNGERHRSTGGLDFGFSMHWLDGPGLMPMPPRLYDLSLAWQHRGEVQGVLRYDVGLSAGLYTDFEDSVREGWRFPGHAVMMLPVASEVDFVLGVDYLDRDDIAALPVAGVSLRDVLRDDLRLDLVFPQPRISWLVGDRSRLYLAGAMGGGTWDVEFPDSSGQLVTLRDYRLSLGLEQRQSAEALTNLEVAWVFGRQLERRGDPAALELDDALLLIMTVRH
ncbi:MAG: hypothetical protein RLZZ436_1686 [Planctomycetota bacterium]|jgi:hypothetical protein